MSNTENPGTVNAIDEQIDENEESSGLKVRTSLKAGLSTSLYSTTTSGSTSLATYSYTPTFNTVDYTALGLSGPRRQDP